MLPVPGTLEEEDSDAHTLDRCKEFDDRRDALVRKIRPFNPLDLIPKMSECPASRETVVTFVEAVMSLKQETG